SFSSAVRPHPARARLVRAATAAMRTMVFFMVLSPLLRVRPEWSSRMPRDSNPGDCPSHPACIRRWPTHSRGGSCSPAALRTSGSRRPGRAASPRRRRQPACRRGRGSSRPASPCTPGTVPPHRARPAQRLRCSRWRIGDTGPRLGPAGTSARGGPPWARYRPSQRSWPAGRSGGSRWRWCLGCGWTCCSLLSCRAGGWWIRRGSAGEGVQATVLEGAADVGALDPHGVAGALVHGGHGAVVPDRRDERGAGADEAEALLAVEDAERVNAEDLAASGERVGGGGGGGGSHI